MLQKIRNEVHRFAITFHRKKEKSLALILFLIISKEWDQQE